MLNTYFLFKNKYLYLLLALIAYFIGMALWTDRNIEGEIHSFTFPVIILFSLYAISSRKPILKIALILALILIIENWFFKFSQTSNTWAITNYMTSLLFLSIITYSVIDNLLAHKEITTNTLLGAISGYILLGFIWIFFYMIISILDPNSFSNTLESGTTHQRLLQFAYYSFVSLVTLGYGDILAVSNLARTLSWLEAILGQTYLAVWIAQLVGLRTTHKDKE